ncbi:hypothetical protein [Stomatobaculum longum]|uniref:hypothetical protein n=1 Tax=Stomatobaculum longum TaxID=796942 RepID=UPI0028E57894|nr:hypothetical protein [Stomatobaculum longum]
MREEEDKATAARAGKDAVNAANDNPKDQKADGEGVAASAVEALEELAENEKRIGNKAEEIASGQEALIYMGPSKGGIAQNTVFADGKLDDRALKVQSMTPRASLLFVPISQLSDARKMLHREGTAIQLAYKALRDREE